jgi:hypothetical protein
MNSLERAMIEGATRVLNRRAAALRKVAADHTFKVEHNGHDVLVAEPEATIALGTARLLDEAAADVAALLIPPVSTGEKQERGA